MTMFLAESANPRMVYEMFWDIKLLTGFGIEFNQPDLVIVDHADKKWTIVDFCIPWDGNVKAREDEKKVKYAPLAGKIHSFYNVKTETIPIVIGALVIARLAILQ